MLEYACTIIAIVTVTVIVTIVTPAGLNQVLQ